MSADHATTPSALGYRQPAEWAPHEATWLSWPHNRDSWPGVFAGVEPAMVEFVRALAECEPVYINVLDADHERHVRKLLAAAVPPERLRFYRFPTNDAWARDHGAIFVTRPTLDAPRLAVDFDYNAWGGKYPPFDLDRQIGRQMAEALGVPRYAKPGVVLEGGSIEVNGEGALLTTEQCLLNPNRNPSLTRADIESAAARLVRRHTRSCGSARGSRATTPTATSTTSRGSSAPGKVVTVVEANRADPNHAPLAANRRLLDDARRRRPAARRRRAADAGAAVPRGPAAAGELRQLLRRERRRARARVRLPGRRCGVRDTRATASPADASCPSTAACSSPGLGALHCLTQQVPAVPVPSS